MQAESGAPLFVLHGNASQASHWPVIVVRPWANVAMSGVYVTGGAGPPCKDQFEDPQFWQLGTGAGIENEGVLQLINCSVAGNRGTGIKNTGRLVLIGANLSNNGPAWQGGGLANAGEALVLSSLLEGNVACANGGGIKHYPNATRQVPRPRLVVNGTVIANNSAYGGAGISISVWGTATGVSVPSLSSACDLLNPAAVAQSVTTLSDTTSLQAGALSLDSSQFALVVMDSIIESNEAQGLAGGGVHLYGMDDAIIRAAFLRAKIRTNRAAHVGGGFGVTWASVCGHDLVISDNSAYKAGGGIYIDTNSTVNLTSSNVTRNSLLAAHSSGGGVGGLTANSSKFEASSTLIADNYAWRGAQLSNSLGTVVLRNRTLIKHSASASDIFNGNQLHYIAPAPLGHYLSAPFQCQQLWCVLARGRMPCPLQRCDYQRHEDRNVSQAVQGDLPTPYPPTCAIGHYGNSTQIHDQSSSSCSGRCPRSHYCGSDGTIKPTPCPTGQFTLTTGVTSHTSCNSCPNGHYLHVVPNGAAPCERCPDNSTTDSTTTQGGSGISSCICKQYYWAPWLAAKNDTGSGSPRLAIEGSKCDPCPDGGDCSSLGTTAESLNITKGFWRPAVFSQPQKCPYPQTCAGGRVTVSAYDENSHATCDPLRRVRGAFCTQCIHPEEVFHHSSETCGPAVTSVVVFVLASVAAIVALAGCVGHSGKDIAICPGTESTQQGRTILWLKAGLRQLVRSAKSSVTSIKICISFYQIVTQARAIPRHPKHLAHPPHSPARLRPGSRVTVECLVCCQMGSVYRTSTPPPYDELLAMIDSLINWVPYLDLRAWLGWSNGLKPRLLLVAVLPPISLAIIGLCQWIRQSILLRRRPKSTSPCKMLRKALMLALIDVMPWVVFVAFFVMIPISSFAFLSVRECDCFLLNETVSGAPIETLCFSPMDYSLRCPPRYGSGDFRRRLGQLYDTGRIVNDDGHDEELFLSTMRIAWATISFYAGVVPLTFGVLLWASRRSEVDGVQTRLSRALSFLYDEYRDGYYCWELLVTAQKLCLVGVLSLSYFSPGHPLQLLCALVISLLYQMLVGWCHPFRKPGLNLLAVFSAASLQFIFITFLSFELSGASTKARTRICVHINKAAASCTRASLHTAPRTLPMADDHSR